MQMTQIYTGAIDTYSFRIYGAELTTTFERDETVSDGSLKPASIRGTSRTIPSRY